MSRRLGEISVDVKEIRPDLNEILPNLNRSDKIKPANPLISGEQQLLLYFSVGSVENRVFMLKLVN